MNQSILCVTSIERRFASRAVLRGVSLDMYAGEILGLIGANGAGKTTLLQIIAGFLTPNAGSVKPRIAERPKVLFLRDKPAYYPKLTVRESLRCFADVLQIHSDVSLDTVLEQAGLSNFENDKTGTLSMGTRQRLSWAHALLLKPAILLLDEPTSFLDPPSVIALRNTLKSLSASGTSILLSSHNLHEIDQLCDRVLYLAHGVVHSLLREEFDSVEALESSFSSLLGGQ